MVFALGGVALDQAVLLQGRVAKARKSGVIWMFRFMISRFAGVGSPFM